MRTGIFDNTIMLGGWQQRVIDGHLRRRLAQWWVQLRFDDFNVVSVSLDWSCPQASGCIRPSELNIDQLYHMTFMSSVLSAEGDVGNALDGAGGGRGSVEGGVSERYGMGGRGDHGDDLQRGG